jgi:hypothetical protein
MRSTVNSDVRMETLWVGSLQPLLCNGRDGNKESPAEAAHRGCRANATRGGDHHISERIRRLVGWEWRRRRGGGYRRRRDADGRGAGGKGCCWGPRAGHLSTATLLEEARYLDGALTRLLVAEWRTFQVSVCI